MRLLKPCAGSFCVSWSRRNSAWARQMMFRDMEKQRQKREFQSRISTPLMWCDVYLSANMYLINVSLVEIKAKLHKDGSVFRGFSFDFSNEAFCTSLALAASECSSYVQQLEDDAARESEDDPYQCWSHCRSVQPKATVSTRCSEINVWSADLPLSCQQHSKVLGPDSDIFLVEKSEKEISFIRSSRDHENDWVLVWTNLIWSIPWSKDGDSQCFNGAFLHSFPTHCSTDVEGA